MAILNYICESCDHQNVCKVHDKITPFHIEAKKDLEVDIRMDGCRNYKEVED